MADQETVDNVQRQVQRAYRSERGQNLLEMAFVSLLLLTLLAGTIDLGHAFTSYIVVTNAAREGARTGSRLPCKTGTADNRADVKAAIVASVLREAASSGTALAAGDVVIVPDPVNTGCAAAGTAIHVTVSSSVGTFLGAFLGRSEVTVRNTATMVAFGSDQSS